MGHVAEHGPSDVAATPQLPTGGCASTQPPPAPQRRARLSKEVVDELLGAFEALVKQGMRDSEIARLTGLSPNQVRTWRRRLKLAGTPGRPRGAASADTPGSGGPQEQPLIENDPILSRAGELEWVTSSKRDHQAFVRAVARLHADDWSIDSIASAMGVTDVDVGAAIWHVTFGAAAS